MLRTADRDGLHCHMIGLNLLMNCLKHKMN